EQQVTIRVYDILGREVRTLFNGIQRGGEHQVLFDASGLPTGVYVYRLVAGEFVESRKMQLVR
ncbi:MAG: T9SS type A sorting domain-containing protein, partial [Bacteroidota bacterium]